MANKNIKSILQFVVLLSIGVLLIWLSIRQITPEQKVKIIRSFKEANYFWIIMAMIISAFSHFLRAYRWNHLLRPTGHSVDLINASCAVFVGYLANYGIPRMGEISRCTLVARYDKVPFEIAFGTVITERIVDLLLFLVIFALTLLLQFNELIGLANKYVFDPLGSRLAGFSESPAKIAVLAAVVVAVLIAFFFLRKKFAGLLKGKLGNILKGMGQGLGSISKMEKPLQFVVLSVLIWLCYFYSLYICFFALEGTSHLGQPECLTLLLFGTFGVMFTPGGLGAYPAILYWILFNVYHVDDGASFALPWIGWTSQFVLILVLGLLSLIVLPIYNRNKHVVSPTAEG